jgi:hypothetical protein
MNWVDLIESDFSKLPDFIDYFENELKEVKNDVSIHGNLEKQLIRMPGLTEKYFGHLQTIEGVLEYLNIQLRKIRSNTFKKYLEGYNKALSSRDAEKYADGTDDVINYELLINRVSYVRNMYLSAVKSLEVKQWQLSNVVRVRASALQDIEL